MTQSFGEIEEQIEPPDGEEYLHEKRRLPAPAGRVQVQTEPNVGWSVFGQLVSHDRRLNATPPAGLQLQVQFEHQMQTHTVQFNGPDNLAVGAIGGVICEAEILWSVEGVTVRRVVTVADGVAVSGEAQSVTVNIYDQSFDRGIRYNVGCTVAPGLRGDTQQPPTLVVPVVTAAGASFPFGISIAPGVTVRFPLPQNVGAISSYAVVSSAAPPGAPLADNSVLITHRNGGGVPIQFYGFTGCFKYVPLFSTTTSVEFTNQHTSNVLLSHHYGIEG